MNSDTLIQSNKQRINKVINRAEEASAQITLALNAVHNTSFSERFWKTLLIKYIFSSALNESGIYSRQGKKKQTLQLNLTRKNLAFLKKEIYQNTVHFIKSLKSAPARFQFKKILKNHNNILYSFHYKEDILKEMDAELPTYYPFTFGKADKSKRQGLIAYAEDVQDKYLRQVLLDLPDYAVEKFSSLYHSIPLYNPEKKIFHVINVDTVFVSLLFAKYVEYGAKLYIYEPGWGGGEKHMVHYTSKIISDKYLTWGWQLDDNDIPSKAYRANGFKKRYESYDNSQKYSCMLCYPNISINNYERLVERSHAFLKNIDRGRYEKIIARPRPFRKIGNVDHQLDFIKNYDIKIDSGKTDIAQLIRQSQLVVHFASPSTTFLECLYVNHPIVTIFQNDCPTEITKSYYEFFFKWGVYHQDALSLVNHLNQLDLNSWWNEIVQQPEYQEFKNLFCRKV